MPTYEYQCQKCGHTFDEYQSIKAEPLQKCNKKGCRGKVKRLIGGGGGLLFKGSGFYITDYRSENYKSGAKKDTAPAASSGADSKGGSDSKATPAAAPAKTETKPATAKAAAT